MYFGHVAIYTRNLEKMKDFYCRYFGGKVFYSGEFGEQKCHYISFDEHCYLELMDMPSVPETLYSPGEERTGLTHIAINAESSEKVRALTAELKKDGYTIILEPTDYGTDIFYESCLLDPDGNRVEICVHADVLKKEHEAGIR